MGEWVGGERGVDEWVDGSERWVDGWVGGWVGGLIGWWVGDQLSDSASRETMRARCAPSQREFCVCSVGRPAGRARSSGLIVRSAGPG